MIIPAILEKNFDEVKEKIKLVEDVAQKIQIDIVDNTVIKGKTFLDISKLEQITTRSELSLHLMVNNPMRYFKKLGFSFLPTKGKINSVSTIITQLILNKFSDTAISDFSNLIKNISENNEVVSKHDNKFGKDSLDPKEKIIKEIHESLDSLMETNNYIIQKFIDTIKSEGYKIGISINPENDTSLLKPFTNQIDVVQFMGVIPGKQGNELIPSVLNKISKFKSEFPAVITQIDGGVDESNFSDILKTGVDNIVVGSSIFRSEDPRSKFLEFQKLFNERKITAHEPTN